MLETFWDDNGGGMFFTADEGDLGVRTKDPYDSAIPSGNSEAAHVLLGLAAATGDDAYLAKAATLLNAFAAPMSGHPRSFGRMLGALDTYLAMAGESSAPQLFALAPESAGDYVTVTTATAASSVDPGSTFEVVVTAQVADGWHINANPASEEFLVPTTISGADGSGVDVVRVDYPEGKPLEFVTGGEPLSVYDGTVTFRVALRTTDAGVLEAYGARLVMDYQVCDEARCLAPTTLEFIAPMPQAAD